MVKSSDAVVAHTRSYAETSPVLKHFLDRVIINPIGVDTKRFNPKTTDGGVREKYNIEDKFVIFTLGRLVPYKGYQYLVKAMKYLDDNFVLVLAGDGMLKNSLMSLTKKLNIEDKIIFTGHLPESKKTNYYASCDVFCLPSISRGEAFGVVLLEAMACGKHVITTSIPGVSEVASIGGGHIVEPKNPVALADAIKESKKIDVDKYKLHQKIESRFSWDKIVGKYLSIYKELG
jgi:rhamnosyl/mannosyltransferase